MPSLWALQKAPEAKPEAMPKWGLVGQVVYPAKVSDGDKHI